MRGLELLPDCSCMHESQESSLINCKARICTKHDLQGFREEERAHTVADPKEQQMLMLLRSFFLSWTYHNLLSINVCLSFRCDTNSTTTTEAHTTLQIKVVVTSTGKLLSARDFVSWVDEALANLEFANDQSLHSRPVLQ